MGEWAVATLGGVPHRVASGFGLVTGTDGNAMFFIKPTSGAIFLVGKSEGGGEEVFRFEDTSIRPVSIAPPG
jgi:hypothetical protein